MEPVQEVEPLEIGAISAELDELALAAGDPTSVPTDAIPLGTYLALLGTSAPVLNSLPSWYMPAATGRPPGRWRLPVVLVIAGAFLIIEALGLCNTFGQLTLA
ncbi:MAG TPA: hypothetical protein VGL60_02720 [Acidimicrobiales bacterium]